MKNRGPPVAAVLPLVRKMMVDAETKREAKMISHPVVVFRFRLVWLPL